MKIKYGKRVLLLALLLLSATGTFAALAGISGSSALVREERDLQLRNVTMEEIEDIKEREKGGMTGLVNIAGWRHGEAGNIKEPVSGKKEGVGTIYVNGPVSLAFPGKVLSGSFEAVMDKKDCILTREVSWSLFGSVNTAGCRVAFGDKMYTVAAVIDREEKAVFFTADEGPVEKAAFSFQGRGRLKARMEALGFE